MEDKNKDQALEDLGNLRARLGELEKLQAKWKEAEEQLKKSEQDYIVRTQSIHDIIYEVDIDGYFVFISNSVAQLGYAPKELIGKHFSTIIYPDDVESVSRAIVLPRFEGQVTGDASSPKLFDERRAGERMTKYLEIRMASKEAAEGYRYAELHSSGKWLSVDEKTHKFIGSIGIIRDITERKKAEETLKSTYQKMELLYKDLEQKNKEFQKLDQLKSDFVANVSHEIKTPIAIIKESVAIVLDQMSEELEKEQKNILIITRENINRLTLMANSLLDVSKIEAGRLDLYRESVNIAEIVKELVSEFEYLADKEQVQFDYELSKDEIIAFCDQEKTRRVLVNLISNAIKFTDKGGRVIASIEDKEDEVLVSVSDTGRGIAAENISKLFDKFTQFGKKSPQREKGTGLGLAISKGIVEQHKGKIWVESKIGKGSKFHFTIPKLNFDEILKEYIEREISQARRKKGHFTVLMLIPEFKSTEQENKKTLKDAEIIVKDTLRRKGDIVITGEEGIVVILPDTDKQSTFLILARIKENLKNILANFKDTVITYPGEAKGPKGILEKLKDV
ncbi:MAG: ATP-binding protein [Candidatus Saelkia tenebricola]|nr:ATP-binding protein [Candidatus Saelkia tenebricola]